MASERPFWPRSPAHRLLRTSLRLTFVRGLFKEMGFEGGELETRTRIFVTAMSLEHGILVRESKGKRLDSLRRWHAFFIRP